MGENPLHLHRRDASDQKQHDGLQIHEENQPPRSTLQLMLPCPILGIRQKTISRNGQYIGFVVGTPLLPQDVELQRFPETDQV